MKKRTPDYWSGRFQQLEEAQHNKSLKKMQEIEQQFRRSEQVIQGKINAWYQRFADNNGMSMKEAKRLLNSEELEEFHWDVQDYIRYGKNNAVTGQWMQQLENASAKVHISRLEALKLQCQQEAEVLYGNYLDSVDRHITDIYQSQYYHTAYEIQKGTGIGQHFQSFNQTLVESIIQKPWAVDGRNFSERIWTDKTKLISTLHNSLTRMCITGEAPDRAIREMKKRMQISQAQAARLVQTEAAAFAAKAQQDCYKELDVEEFEVLETLDEFTCPTCGDMDKKHFPMSEYVVGVTAPPFHPNCRGCTCPYFDDEWATSGKRVARRKEDGKEYYVPENMTYKEWKETYLDKEPGQEEKSTLLVDLKSLEKSGDSGILSIDEVINKAKQFGDDIIQGKEKIVYDNGNPIYDYVARRLNYDALPKIVTAEDFATMSKESPVGILYRGIEADTKEEAKQYAYEFMSGKMYAGKKYAYGSGTYFSPDKSTSEKYSNQGVMLKALLSKDAKVVKYKDIIKDYSSTGADVARQKKGNNTEAWEDILSSVSEFAAIKGYDAINMDGVLGQKHIIVLNRGKVVIEE